MANPVFETVTEKTVLWLDLWGMSKTLENHKQSGGDLLDQAEIAHRLAIFISILANVANQKQPNLEVAQGSDGAFVIGDDPNDVFEVALIVLRQISYFRFNFFFIPVRAGMSKNLIEVASNRTALAGIPRFSFLPYLGEGFAKAYKMEAMGRKGMRFFVTDSVRKTLNPKFQAMVSANAEPNGVSILKEPAEAYFEVNWMEQAYLNSPSGNAIVRDDFTKLISAWSQESSFQVEMAKSLIDMISWTDSGAHVKTW